MQRKSLISPDSWAMLREAYELTRGGQKAIQRALAKMSAPNKEVIRRNLEREQRHAPKGEFESLDLNPADLDALEEANDACVLALVTSWSYEAPLTQGGLDLIPLQDYKELQKLCAPAIASAQVDFSATEESVKDQNSPFGSSSESSGLSVVESSTAVSPTPSTPTESFRSPTGPPTP